MQYRFPTVVFRVSSFVGNLASRFPPRFTTVPCKPWTIQ